jgi:pimeloyl-ACP methyl ester carboxylesterase
MKTHKIKGGGGVQLHVTETGNPNGRPILFIHGFSQCGSAWTRQLDSDLAKDYRLIAMDMRGHGQSEKPRDRYGDSKAWADDVNAVIKALNLRDPILVGWSYGPLVILDYIRHYGEGEIGGVNFVGGITKLGSEEATAVLAPDFLALVPGFFSEDEKVNRSSLESLLRMCFVSEVSDDEISQMVDDAMQTPSHVRQALFSRAFDNDDLMPKIKKPVLVTHGDKDPIVTPSIVDQHKSSMPHAEIHMMANTGHAPFYEDAPAYNQRLREFCEAIGDPE